MLLIVLPWLIIVFCPPAWAQEKSVKIRPLRDLVIFPETSAPASVVSLSDSRIGAELSAVVAAIAVRVGDVIEAGDLLAQLNCGDYDLRAAELSARLEIVNARVNFAEQQLKRAESLKKQRTVAQELVDQRQVDLSSLLAEQNASRAALNIVNRDREKCTVRSPFRAVVLERLASVGEYVTPGTALVRILDVDNLEISAAILDRDGAELVAAESVLFRYKEQDYPVALRVLTPRIDPQSRTREARFQFLGKRTLAGAAGRLVWRAGPALPADLLLRRNGQLGVMLARNGRATFHPLPEAIEGRYASIALPLTVDVITAGRFALNDGDLIVPVTDTVSDTGAVEK